MNNAPALHIMGRSLPLKATAISLARRLIRRSAVIGAITNNQKAGPPNSASTLNNTSQRASGSSGEPNNGEDEAAREAMPVDVGKVAPDHGVCAVFQFRERYAHDRPIRRVDLAIAFIHLVPSNVKHFDDAELRRHRLRKADHHRVRRIVKHLVLAGFRLDQISMRRHWGHRHGKDQQAT